MNEVIKYINILSSGVIVRNLMNKWIDVRLKSTFCMFIIYLEPGTLSMNLITPILAPSTTLILLYRLVAKSALRISHRYLFFLLLSIGNDFGGRTLCSADSKSRGSMLPMTSFMISPSMTTSNLAELTNPNPDLTSSSKRFFNSSVLVSIALWLYMIMKKSTFF